MTILSYLLNRRLVPFQDFEGNWGYLDESQIIVKIDAIFAGAKPFSEGLGAVKVTTEWGPDDTLVENKWGYIDETGTYVIYPQFDEANEFSEGLAAVMNDDGWGYIDHAGKIIIPFQYESAGYFSEGLAAVEIGDKFGYIDATNNFVIQPQFDNAMKFVNGYAEVMIGLKWYRIDKSGKNLGPTEDLIHQMYIKICEEQKNK